MASLAHYDNKYCIGQHFFFWITFLSNAVHVFFFLLLQLTLLNPPREGKKCLVLDIDYTLFDHRSSAENPRELMRPCKYLLGIPQEVQDDYTPCIRSCLY